MCSISLKHGSVLNTHSNDFIRMHIECVTSRKQEIASGFTVRGDYGVLVKGDLMVYQSFIPGVSAPCH